MSTDRGWDPALWRQMSEQIGIAGLIIPEEYGGAGFGPVELCIVMEEMGRSLACAPLLGSSVAAAAALLQCADERTKKTLLPGIATGESIGCLATAEPNGRWDIAGIEMIARETGDGFVLDGEKRFVLEGANADVLLVAARSDEGLSLFRVDANSNGVTRSRVPALDLTRSLAHLEFAAAPAIKVSRGNIEPQLNQVQALTIAAIAADQAGGMQICLELSTDYAKTRLQFGRPIGSYQAIKHKCADMLVDVEFAKTAAYNALFTAAEAPDDLIEAAAMAKSYCSEAYFGATMDMIQIHGGMGFTWEHPAHLYFKRAKASQVLFGDSPHHREVISERLGL